MIIFSREKINNIAPQVKQSREVKDQHLHIKHFEIIYCVKKFWRVNLKSKHLLFLLFKSHISKIINTKISKLLMIDDINEKMILFKAMILRYRESSGDHFSV